MQSGFSLRREEQAKWVLTGDKGEHAVWVLTGEAGGHACFASLHFDEQQLNLCESNLHEGWRRGGREERGKVGREGMLETNNLNLTQRST